MPDDVTEPTQPIAPAEAPQLTDTAVMPATGFIPCACGNRLITEPPLQVPVNHPHVSAVLFPHEEPVICKCGRQYLPVLQGFQAVWAYAEVEKTHGSLIVPGTGGKIFRPR